MELKTLRWILAALLVAACGSPTEQQPHRWVERTGADRHPHTYCLCVEPTHGGTFVSVSVFGDTLKGHEARTQAEVDDCLEQLQGAR